MPLIKFPKPRADRIACSLTKTMLQNVKGAVLDIGCSDFIDYLGFKPGNNYIGLDIEKTKYVSVIGDGLRIPFNDQSFDFIICNAVLEHVQEPKKVIDESRFF